MQFMATRRRAQVAPFSFEYRGPDGQEFWTFEGEYVPGEPDVGISPHWEHDRVLDEYGDERDPEDLCGMWWEEVTKHADELVREEMYGDAL